MKARLAAFALMVAAIGVVGVASPASAQPAEPSSTTTAVTGQDYDAKVTWGIHSTHPTRAKCVVAGQNYTQNSGYGFKCERQVTDHSVLYYLWTWLPG